MYNSFIILTFHQPFVLNFPPKSKVIHHKHNFKIIIQLFIHMYNFQNIIYNNYGLIVIISMVCSK